MDNEIGAFRKDSNGIYGGFYKKEEIKEIIDYAKIRHINIIPEIEKITPDYLNKFKIPGLKVLHDKPTNEKGPEVFEQPDLRISIKSKPYNIEIKSYFALLSTLPSN